MANATPTATPTLFWALLTALATAFAVLMVLAGVYWPTVPVAACGLYGAARLFQTALALGGETR